jgi:beta-galactosidase GanA
MSDPIPRIESLPNGASQLLVGGKPYLMRGGELHNSSLSSPSYMDDVWQKLVDSHINTVLGSVSWEQIEPAEGQFDFRILDGMIRKARQHGLRLVLLWFGAHKNGRFT